MKRIKSICAAMMCCAVVAGFSSCSKDDDQPNGPAVKMQLTGMTITEDGKSAVFSNFTYDDEGRLTSYEVNSDGRGKENVTYTYSGSSIVVKSASGTDTYNLTNGIITSQNLGGHKYSYTYTSGCLTKEVFDNMSDYASTYYWEGGNPIRDTSDETVTYIYSDKPCYIGNLQTFFDHYSSVQVELLFGSWEASFLQQQGYFGNLPKNLVTSAIYKGEVWWTLDYELNSNGYPTKITAKDDSATAVMTLTWK